MKQKTSLNEYRLIADLHAQRLKTALNKVNQWAPLTAEKFKNMNDHQIAFLDMLTTRFSKLQDVIGTKIFPLLLNLLAEDAKTFIDKLNTLEKLGYLDDANWWLALREVRNQITHDYPNNYELLSQHFNSLLKKTSDFLLFWQKLKEKIDSSDFHGV